MHYASIGKEYIMIYELQLGPSSDIYAEKQAYQITFWRLLLHWIKIPTLNIPFPSKISNLM